MIMLPSAATVNPTIFVQGNSVKQKKWCSKGINNNDIK
uniref:Uncharacterized protein n=1 Tax=Arundo donax TaxID=35708 RepID=A0A0A9DS90_ARUDO